MSAACWARPVELFPQSVLSCHILVHSFAMSSTGFFGIGKGSVHGSRKSFINIETIFLMSSDKNSFISSNFVKEVHRLGADVSNFVSKNTIKILDIKNTSS